jgi:hypothetical protein
VAGGPGGRLSREKPRLHEELSSGSQWENQCERHSGALCSAASNCSGNLSPLFYRRPLQIDTESVYIFSDILKMANVLQNMGWLPTEETVQLD